MARKLFTSSPTYSRPRACAVRRYRRRRPRPPRLAAVRRPAPTATGDPALLLHLRTDPRREARVLPCSPAKSRRAAQPRSYPRWLIVDAGASGEYAPPPIPSSSFASPSANRGQVSPPALSYAAGCLLTITHQLRRVAALFDLTGFKFVLPAAAAQQPCRCRWMWTGSRAKRRRILMTWYCAPSVSFLC